MPRIIARARTGPVFFTALVSVTSITALTLHIFAPALPDLQRDFELPLGTLQLTMSLALATMAAMTLVYGPLSDRFGRRPALIVGLCLFVAGAGIAGFAPNPTVLILGRIVQGAGAACGFVLARAIARDVYGADRLANMIGYITAAYAASIMLAPALGGFLVDLMGWRAGMVLVFILGTGILALAVFVLAETNEGRGVRARPLEMARGYITLLRSRRIVAFALTPAFISAAFYMFMSGAPHVIINLTGRSATEFGLFFITLPFFFMLGNFISGKFSGRIAIEPMVLTGAGVSLAGMIGMGVWIAAAPLSPWALFIPMWAHSMGQGLALPNATAGGINQAGRLAGTASSLFVFISLTVSALGTQLVGILDDGTEIPLVAGMIVASALAVIAAITAVTAKRPVAED